MKRIVYVIGLAAAGFLGAGWVIQQRIATQSKAGGVLSWAVIVELATSWLWWAGIAAMTIGQSLSAWALQFGPVSAVEPVLVVSLLVALLISAIAAHHRPSWPELIGPLVLCVALIVFLSVSDPRVNRHNDPGWVPIMISTVIAGGVAAVIAGIAYGSRKRTPDHGIRAVRGRRRRPVRVPGRDDPRTIAALGHRSLFALFDLSGRGDHRVMFADILIALVIVVIAVVLGIVVHPLLWFLLIVAALWLFGRGRSRSGHAHL